MPDQDENTGPQKTSRGFEYTKGKWVPWWAILFIPFLILLQILYHPIKDQVNWRAAWLTVLVFEVMCVFAEHYQLQRGHWVYNEARILGPKIWGLPIEEPFLYYLFSPLVMICIFHTVKRYIAKKEGGNA
jgi:lycopene cyclase domain-containing protein